MGVSVSPIPDKVKGEKVKNVDSKSIAQCQRFCWGCTEQEMHLLFIFWYSAHKETPYFVCNLFLLSKSNFILYFCLHLEYIWIWCSFLHTLSFPSTFRDINYICFQIFQIFLNDRSTIEILPLSVTPSHQHRVTERGSWNDVTVLHYRRNIVESRVVSVKVEVRRAEDEVADLCFPRPDQVHKYDILFMKTTFLFLRRYPFLYKTPF